CDQIESFRFEQLSIPLEFTKTSTSRQLSGARHLDLWINGSVHPSLGPPGHQSAPPGRGSAIHHWREGASPGCRLLLRRLPKLVVELRLTEILIEVGGIADAGAGEVCLFRVGIRAAAAFASGGLLLDAPASLCLPAAVAGIGVRLGFRSRLCPLPGLRIPLAVIVLRTGPGRGLARLAVLVP